jgi:uncharacterized repeat protein (TIGR04138 family)
VARTPASEFASLNRLLAEDRRYKVEAYQFVAAGLEYAQKVLGMGTPQPSAQPGREGEVARHVTGQELCWALRQLAHQQYGRLAKLVLASWGIHSTSDFGEIVYNLIRVGHLSKSPRDRREDFDNVYDFEQALVQEFVITKEEAEACHP